VQLLDHDLPSENGLRVREPPPGQPGEVEDIILTDEEWEEVRHGAQLPHPNPAPSPSPVFPLPPTPSPSFPPPPPPPPPWGHAPAQKLGGR
jgi:hypothetical protein